MKLLVVHPGASVSTHDVWVGLKAGLQAQDCEIFDYALDNRIGVSAKFLNYAWAKSGKTTDKPNRADILYHAGETLVARALRVQPDWVLIVSAMFLHPDVIVLLKRAGLKIAILFTESPYDDEPQSRLLPFCDLAWTNERTSAKTLGINYLPHALNPEVHNPDAPVDRGTPQHDVVFVGTGFQERIDTLAAVDWTGIDLGLYGSWDLLGSRNKLRQYIRGGYQDNARTTALYRKAKIGLNLYRTSKGFGKDAPRIANAESLNPRAYELAAVGCFTISDHRSEIGEVFGECVPTFDDPSEIRPLVDVWLHDDARRIAVRSQLTRLVQGHTWHARAESLYQDLLAAEKPRRAYIPSTRPPCIVAAVSDDPSIGLQLDSGG